MGKESLTVGELVKLLLSLPNQNAEVGYSALEDLYPIRKVELSQDVNNIYISF